MNQTEAWNRIVAIEVGRMQYMDVMNKLLDPRASKGEKRMGEDFLRRMGQFTDKDILELKSGKILENTPEGRQRFDFLLNKFESYVHKATQGGTGPLEVPPFMAGKHKHWFLFQRIATSVTAHLVNGVVKPAFKGNFAPLMKYAAASMAGGTVYQMFKQWLGNEVNPVESEDLLDEALFYLWRAEFAGMFGGLFEMVPGLNWNPYKDITSGPDIMREFTPQIAGNLAEAFKAIVSAVSGQKSWARATKDLAKRTVVGYGQADKFYKRRLTKNKDTYTTLQDAYEYNRQYRMSVGKKRGFGFVETGSWRTAYYRDIKDALFFGSEEEIAKTYYAAYNYIMAELEKTDSGSTDVSRHKDAIAAINGSMDHMNPLNLSDDATGRAFSKRDAYIKWLREQDMAQRTKDKMLKTVLKGEKIYQAHKRKVESIYLNPEWKLKYSAYPNM